jgi:bifunctional ADP-heptose synthase (sugar kinase/adenylyltransferase)
MLVAGLAGEHSRYDTKNRTPTSGNIEQRVISSIEAILPDVDAMVILDQVEQANCGVVTEQARDALSRLAAKNPGVLFWADSRRHIRQFRDIVIKPNQFEAFGIDSPAPGESIPLEMLRNHARQLRQELNAPVVITRGTDGLLICEEDCILIPSLRIEGPIDPTGAGDSTTAGCVLAMCAGGSLAEAGIVGTLVASVTVQQLSTTGTAHPDQLPHQLEEWQRQTQSADT